jgi:hypothetical protein
MRNAITFLAAAALAVLFTAGCAGPEPKTGRGMGNFNEVFNRPGQTVDPLFETDIYVGFSGGIIAPWIPGNQFRVFDN